MALYTNDVGTYFEDRLLDQIKQRENDEIRSFLQKGDPRYMISSSAATLLHYAAEYNNDEIVQYLIDHGSNINAQNQLKETPLMLALEGKFTKTIGILLAANADIYKNDVYGVSSLSRVFNENKLMSEEIIQMFLHKVANDKRDDEFVADKLIAANCPIYRVVYLRKSKVTKFMLEKGVSLAVREPRTGRTPLHIAVKKMDVENAKVLLEHKADVNAVDCNGKKPLSLIPNISDVANMIMLLLRRGSVLQDNDCSNVDFQHVLLSRNGQAIRTYLANNIDLNAIVREIFYSFVRFYRLIQRLFDLKTEKSD